MLTVVSLTLYFRLCVGVFETAFHCVIRHTVVQKNISPAVCLAVVPPELKASVQGGIPCGSWCTLASEPAENEWKDRLALRNECTTPTTSSFSFCSLSLFSFPLP